MSEHAFRSLPEMFLHRVSESANERALHYPEGESWRWLTWKETGERVQSIACGLLSLGIQPEQRCALQSSTRVEWILIDLGIMCAGAATTTVYPSTNAEDSGYILQDSESRVLFAENAKQVEKAISQRAALQHIDKVIVIEDEKQVWPDHQEWIITLAELEKTGQQHTDEHKDIFEKTVRAIESEHLATLIYTSGTTGKPKGVELIHDSWVSIGEGIAALGTIRKEDHQYLWLPLSHAFGKALEAAQIAIGMPTSVDGRIPKLVENLAIVRPTFMAAAPRIFEKVFNKVVTKAKAGGPIKWHIFEWALRIGRQISALKLKGRNPSLLLAAQYALADRLVFSKIRDRFGGRVRFFISGSAPLSMEMAEFFHAAGITILEGYGLTETSAASFVNTLNDFRFGTVGKAIGDTEVRISDSDGEILIRGRGVMRGYHNFPEQSAEVLDPDGWLKTGDIGEVDANGFLKITDRKKDLIKTSGGKYVAPQLLEGKIKALCPYIGHVVVHGDRRNFCSALVTIDEEAISEWAAQENISGSYADLTQNDRVRGLVQQAIDALNRTVSRHETIKKFAILPRDLTLEMGELTPSLKVKRRVVETLYAQTLDSFYTEAVQSL